MPYSFKLNFSHSYIHTILTIFKMYIHKKLAWEMKKNGIHQFLCFCWCAWCHWVFVLFRFVPLHSPVQRHQRCQVKSSLSLGILCKWRLLANFPLQKKKRTKNLQGHLLRMVLKVHRVKYSIIYLIYQTCIMSRLLSKFEPLSSCCRRHILLLTHTLQKFYRKWSSSLGLLKVIVKARHIEKTTT